MVASVPPSTIENALLMLQFRPEPLKIESRKQNAYARGVPIDKDHGPTEASGEGGIGTHDAGATSREAAGCLPAYAACYARIFYRSVCNQNRFKFPKMNRGSFLWRFRMRLFD